MHRVFITAITCGCLTPASPPIPETTPDAAIAATPPAKEEAMLHVTVTTREIAEAASTWATTYEVVGNTLRVETQLVEGNAHPPRSAQTSITPDVVAALLARARREGFAADLDEAGPPLNEPGTSTVYDVRVDGHRFRVAMWSVPSRPAPAPDPRVLAAQHLVEALESELRR